MNEFDILKQNVLGYYSEEDRVRLESWSLGGSYGNCWDESMVSVSASEQPDCDRFDEVIENLFGDISYLKYKNIKKECLSIETEYENDYYGGGTEEAYYVLDLNKLYEIYKELNLK